jgi:hypothetical protein
MPDRQRQRASRQSNKPNRGDLAEILNEIRFAHEQAGRHCQINFCGGEGSTRRNR